MRTLAVAAALSFVGAAAFAQDVKVDFDKDAELRAPSRRSPPRSARAGTTPSARSGSSTEIEQTLTEKGWTKADADKADALVVLHGATEKQKTLNTFYSAGGYGGYGWRGMGGGGMGTATTTDLGVPRGHPGRGHLRREDRSSSCTGASPRTRSRTRRTRTSKKVAKASDKLFKDFPPGSKDKK